MTADAANALRGVRVLVTRPEHQAQILCDKIEALGGSALRLPVIEIAGPRDITSTLDIIKRLKDFHIAIFISSNAVEKTHALITAHGKWPQNLEIAAIGAHTAESLQHIGRHVDIQPRHQFNSEALLALKEMQEVRGKHIVIFKGEGGRELLEQALVHRGANVEFAEVYRRIKPVTDISAIQNAGMMGNIHFITVTSNEGLLNLHDMVGKNGHHWLVNTPVAVINQRTALLAQELGFKTCVIAEQASDQGLVAAIKGWYAIHAPR